MKLNKKGVNAVLFGAVAASSLLLVACGGGGGGGGTTSSVTYTGLTTAAAVDNQVAAVNYSESAVSGSVVTSTSVPLFGVNATTTEGVSSVERLRSLADTVMSLDYASVASDTLAGATVSDVAEGCTGSASATLSYEELDGIAGLSGGDKWLSANVTFTNYREPDENYGCGTYTMTYNGAATITFLHEDPYDYTWITGMTLSTPYMATTDETGATEKMTGSYTFSMYPGTDITMTMTADYQDATGVVYRVKDYRVVISVFYGITSVDGILCDPAEGCIEIDTNPVFGYDTSYTCSYPISGVLTIYGYDLDTETRTSQHITVDAGADAGSVEDPSGCYTYQVCWNGATSACVVPDPMW